MWVCIYRVCGYVLIGCVLIGCVGMYLDDVWVCASTIYLCEVFLSSGNTSSRNYFSTSVSCRRTLSVKPVFQSVQVMWTMPL